jgi:hypothetical protein
MIDGNNGEPVAPGYHSYMVFFVKKPDFDKKNDEPSLNTPSGFRLKILFPHLSVRFQRAGALFRIRYHSEQEMGPN